MEGVALRGVEAAIGYKELTIVTMKKTYKKSINTKQPSKANPIKGSCVIRSKIDK